MIGTTVTIRDVPFRLVAHPLYKDAHPEEPCDPLEECLQCAVGERVDTGEHYLLWCCGMNSKAGRTWSVSRSDPRYEHFHETAT